MDFQAGRVYAKNLGINLDLGGEKELFKWFLACLLFGKPIQQEVAKKTFFEFEKNNLTSPKRIINSGWDKLVKVLDDGHYVRYDYSTADKLLQVCGQLLDKYGTIRNLIKASDNIEDLKKRMLEFKGIGSVTAKIFIRDIKKVFLKIKNKNKRVFVGIKISEGLENKILRLEEDIKLSIPWLSPDNLHITIVPPWEEDDLRSLIGNLKNISGEFRKFKIILNNISLRSGKNKSKLICLEGKARKDIIKLKTKIEELLNLKKQKRAFSLHLTLARFKAGIYKNINKKIKRKINWEENITSIVIFESILLPEGALYKIIKKIKLSEKDN